MLELRLDFWLQLSRTSRVEGEKGVPAQSRGALFVYDQESEPGVDAVRRRELIAE
jgi:hypothetical protein